MIIELHAHTKEVSGCGRVAVNDVIDRYHNAGYDGIVISNHLSIYSLGYEKAEKSWDEFVDSYLAPVKEGREYAKKYGMKVFFGCELRFSCDKYNDFLLYGMTEEFLRNNPGIIDMSIAQFAPIAKENGILIYQAHPFRDWIQVIPTEYLFGIEVNNGHPRHESRNDFARLWADTHGLSMISGSDFHEEGDEAHGGIITFRDVAEEKELCKVLRNGEYKLICDCCGGLLRR